MFFLQLATNQRHGKRTGIDWCIDLLQKEWQSANVVFVTVRNKDPFNLIFVFNQVVVVLNNVVDPQQLVFWEQDPTVNNDDLILELNTVHVLADLAQATHRIKSDFIIFDF